MPLNSDALIKIEGGSVSWLINYGKYIVQALDYIIDLGRYVGSSLRHLVTGPKC